ncbi:MAG: hypothetical protein DLM68_18490 [Hyphomicrobiales bacterium]|nr:MAG: hypothetical protein DLM68_18490 [Hyphomicrobiales bacterium]
MASNGGSGNIALPKDRSARRRKPTGFHSPRCTLCSRHQSMRMRAVTAVLAVPVSFIAFAIWSAMIFSRVQGRPSIAA